MECRIVVDETLAEDEIRCHPKVFNVFQQEYIEPHSACRLKTKADALEVIVRLIEYNDVQRALAWLRDNAGVSNLSPYLKNLMEGPL